MVKKEQIALSEEDTLKALVILNDLGKFLWERLWREDMAIPRNLDVDSKDENNRELILRYLFLRVALNQQGESINIRNLARELIETFGRQFLVEPMEYLKNTRTYDTIIKLAQKYGGPKGADLYSPGRLRGIKPFYILMSRVSLWALFIETLNSRKITIVNILRDLIKDEYAVSKINEWLKNEYYISLAWVGKDPKASRMLTDWIVYLWAKVWKIDPLISIHLMPQTLMIVDGHVGKVFARIGILRTVDYEKTRPYIIEATKMRDSIQQIVLSISSKHKLTPFYIDYAAFSLGMSLCGEERAICEINEPEKRKTFISKTLYGPYIRTFTNNLNCPLEHICKKYTHWTAYRQR